MIDRLVAFGSMFDWITPFATWMRDLFGDRSVGYNISVHSGWSALAIQQELRDAGVKTWGLTIFGDIITFRVRVAQARYAQYLMERCGIPFEGGLPVSAKMEGRANSATAAGQSEKMNSDDKLLDPIYKVAGKLSRL